MRADRLVAALLVLQAKGRVTTAELADELEVSIRTARRDLEALAMAGIPVYPQRGRGGGWTLLGGARTDLTGLTASEAQALFLTVGTSALASPALKSAAKKLVQALPETFRGDATRATDSVIIDQSRWGRTAQTEQVDHLETLQAGLLAGRQIRLDYVGRDQRRSTRAVHPLGLVTKAGTWYLVAGTDGGQRTFRVSRVVAADIMDTAANQPDGFDLSAAWSAITDTVERDSRPANATGFADSWALGPLRFLFGQSVTIGEVGEDGRHHFAAWAPSDRALAGQLAGLGSAIEVTGPPTVRALLAAIGRELIAAYGDGLEANPTKTSTDGNGPMAPHHL